MLITILGQTLTTIQGERGAQMCIRDSYTCIIAAHDAASGTYEERVDIPIIVGRFLLLKSLDFAQGAAYGPVSYTHLFV